MIVFSLEFVSKYCSEVNTFWILILIFSQVLRMCTLNRLIKSNFLNIMCLLNTFLKRICLLFSSCVQDCTYITSSDLIKKI